MQDDDHKIHTGGNGVELALQPIALSAGGLVQRAVQREHQHVARAYGIVQALLQLRIPLEIVCQAHLQVAVKIVIAQRRIDANVLLAPDRGLAVIHFPIVEIVPVVGDVAAEGDKVRMSAGNGLDQLAARFRIGRIGVSRIGKARVAVGDEMDPVALIQVQISRLRRQSHPGKQARHQKKQILPRLKHGPIPYTPFNQSSVKKPLLLRRLLFFTIPYFCIPTLHRKLTTSSFFVQRSDLVLRRRNSASSISLSQTLPDKGAIYEAAVSFIVFSVA